MSDGDATGYGAASGEGDDDERPDVPPDDHPGSPLGALPDPLDRLWMHPSELAGVGAASSRPTALPSDVDGDARRREPRVRS